MTKSLLTEYETMRVFHLYCPGEVKYVGDHSYHTTVDLVGVSSVNRCLEIVYKNPNDSTLHGWPHDHKLLLNDLKSISNIHALQIARIEGLVNAKVSRFHDRMELIDHTYKLYIYFDARIQLSKGGRLMPVERYDLIFQFLILKAYAMPLYFGLDHKANNKTAIELGLAIQKQI